MSPKMDCFDGHILFVGLIDMYIYYFLVCVVEDYEHKMILKT